MNCGKKLDTIIKNLPNGWVVLVETSSQSSLATSLDAVKFLICKKFNVIILSATRPYSNMKALYEKNKIDIENIYFIDAVSENLSAKGNVVFAKGTSDLTGISIHLDKLTKKIKGPKAFTIDTMSSMLIHNDPVVYAKFIHSNLTKMRTREINVLLVSLKGEIDESIRAEITQLCDKVVKV